MKHYNPDDHPLPFVHRLLLGGVAPRPIALVSTVDAEGNVNLSPFSFFNAFGANPPIVVVSPAFRGSDGTPKHTYDNILATGEFTVSAVSFDMTEQISLASSNYDRGVDEFVKAGFSRLIPDRVAPPGVAESPFVMECRLLRHIDGGGKPGSGNLMLGEVLMFHVRDDVFDGEQFDIPALDLVARMGGNWYCRAAGDALFELPKPRHNGIGMDALPEHLRQSTILTANDLAKLAGVETLPEDALVLERWRNLLSGRSLVAGERNLAAGDDLAAGERNLVADNDVQAHGDSAKDAGPDNPAAAAALLRLLRQWIHDEPDVEKLVEMLQYCARDFLADDDLDRAWDCALISRAEMIRELSSRNN